MLSVHESTKKIEKVMSKNTKEVRDCTGFKDMQGLRQGDVYVVKFTSKRSLNTIFAKIRKNKNKLWSFFKPTELECRKTKQLAVGETKGSRHIASGNCEVKFYKQETGSHPCLGGVIEATGPWTLNHPTHGNGHFAAGTFVFWYQMDTRLKDVARRVMD